MTAALLRAWQLVRAILGDDAYDRYCAHRQHHHPGEALLDRRSYYLQAQEQKWSGVSRCC